MTKQETSNLRYQQIPSFTHSVYVRFVGVYVSVFSQSPWWKKPRPFLPDWPLRGRGHHQLCQPVKWPLQHTADYMECKTLEKCVWNIRVTCLKWQWVGGGQRHSLEREEPWQVILFEGIVTHSSGQGRFLWPQRQSIFWAEYKRDGRTYAFHRVKWSRTHRLLWGSLLVTRRKGKSVVGL